MEYNTDSYVESNTDSDTESYDSIPDDPMLKPIYYWSLVLEEREFIDDPDIGTGRFYRGDGPFGSGYFVDKNGLLSQVRPVQEGGWKRESTDPDYKLIFRMHEGKKYMYVDDVKSIY